MRVLPALFAALLLGAPAHAHGVGARGMQPVAWHTEQIRAVVSGGIGSNTPGRVETIEGRACMAGSPLHLDVFDALAFDIDETVRIEVEFDLATSSSEVALEYDGNRGAGATQRVHLPVRRGTRWHEQTFDLERARFAGLGPFGTDFSITATSPTPKAPEGTVTICSLSIERSHTTPEPAASGNLALEILDESGQRVPARVGIYDASGRLPLPDREAIPVESFTDVVRVVTLRPGSAPWPATNRQAFYVDGSYHARLPAGRYELVATRGLEYRIERQSFVIPPGGENRLRVRMKRWTDMPARGWYSGDVHIHRGRDGPGDDRDALLQMQAEDLHVANLLQMGNIGAAHFQQYDWGPSARHGALPHVLVPGQEDPRTIRRGHTIQLNLREPIRDPERYYLYHEVFEKTHAQGGLTGYAHVDAAFHDGVGSRSGLALDVPFGLVDFVEVMQMGEAWTRTWFDFLDLGFALSPAAGTDYPYVDHPGAVRSYVDLGRNPSVQGWFDGLKAGRTFVTNGPLLELDVNGRGMGAQLRVEPGATLAIEASARINPDIDALDRLELVEQGEIVARAASREGAEELRLTHRARVAGGTWFVLIAHGKQQGPNAKVAAMSAPVYVSVDGGGFCDPRDLPALAAGMKEQLQKMMAPSVQEEYEIEAWDTQAPRFKYWPAQVPLLQRRIDAAAAVYDDLSERAKQQRCRADPSFASEAAASR